MFIFVVPIIRLTVRVDGDVVTCLNNTVTCQGGWHLYIWSWLKCWVTHHDMRSLSTNDDVIKLKHFPRHWPFVRGIHRSLVNSPHKGQWRGPLMFSLICTRVNGRVNSGFETPSCPLWRHRNEMLVSRAKASNYMPQILWDVVNCHWL